MSRGGARVGAGKKPGSGKYGEPTKAMKIPISRIGDVINLINPNTNLVNLSNYEIPLYSTKVQAGFPSPADDYIEKKLDLNHHLIERPNSTFLVKATGDSMYDAGIWEGDILIVDKSIKPTNGKIVIAIVDGNFTVKRLKIINGKIFLCPENDKFKPTEINEEGVQIWGVVMHVIKSYV